MEGLKTPDLGFRAALHVGARAGLMAALLAGSGSLARIGLCTPAFCGGALDSQACCDLMCVSAFHSLVPVFGGNHAPLAFAAFAGGADGRPYS